MIPSSKNFLLLTVGSEVVHFKIWRPNSSIPFIQVEASLIVQKIISALTLINQINFAKSFKSARSNFLCVNAEHQRTPQPRTADHLSFIASVWNPLGLKRTPPYFVKCQLDDDSSKRGLALQDKWSPAGWILCPRFVLGRFASRLPGLESGISQAFNSNGRPRTAQAKERRIWNMGVRGQRERGRFWTRPRLAFNAGLIGGGPAHFCEYAG